MKLPLFSLFFAVFVQTLLVTFVAAEVTDKPTAGDVNEKRKRAAEVYERFRKEAEALKAKEEASSEKGKKSLLAESDFLVGPHGFIIVPKGAVVSEGKMVTVSADEPTRSRLLGWEEFYRKHRAGLRFIAISEGQWTGKESLEDVKKKVAEARKKSFTTLTLLNDSVVSMPQLQAAPSAQGK